MKQETNTYVSGGTSIVGLLGVAFVILKLLGIITWSWWLVTLPFWGGFALLLVIAIIAFVVYIFYRVVFGGH